METKHSDESTDDEPNAKRSKMESAVSTSSKPKADEPFLTLPIDIVSKIIAYIPVAQWSSLETLDKHFLAATLDAWRQLRRINVERELSLKSENADDRSSFGETVKCVQSLLQKLAERSPFLTSLSKIDIQLIHTELISDGVCSLAQFEHLQSISVGDAKLFSGLPLEAVVTFLESSRSRTSLKEMRFFNVDQLRNRATILAILDRLASSFVNGRDIQSALKLEKISFHMSFDRFLFIRLDNLDASRLTDLRVRNASIEPDQLANVIERASNLRLIELSFLHCPDGCNGQRLQGNKKLLSALASRENLAAAKIDWFGCSEDVNCMHFGNEFIDMLKAIGRRGQLRKLAIENFFVFPIDMIEVCVTIREHIPYLQSIKLDDIDVFGEIMSEIVNLAELEEIDVMNSHAMTAPYAAKIAELPHLRRLAFEGMCTEYSSFVDPNFLKPLAEAATLIDLRIRNCRFITADVFEKWSEGFASNLQILMLGRIAEKHEHAETGLVRLLEKAIRLRVLILTGHITDQSLMAIAHSCPKLETLGIQSPSNAITVGRLQDILDRCPKLARLGGLSGEIRSQLQFPKYRKIANVDMQFWKYDFDSDEYD